MQGNNVERLDKALVSRGLADTRSQAQRMIEAGRVRCQASGNWQVLNKASAKVSEEQALDVEPGDEDQFASRGGLKLRGALAQSGLNPEGWVALDVGQSTGGFTDCLLQAGATRVVGVDVGRDQLVPALRAHPKVVYFEGINARDLPRDTLLAEAPAGFDLIVMDVSFISQTLILPGLPALLKPGGHLLSLVKPQFEVGKAGIGKGGIVRDDRLYAEVEQRIRAQCDTLGLTINGWFASPIKGGDGNREFFISATKTPEGF